MVEVLNSFIPACWKKENRESILKDKSVFPLLNLEYDEGLKKLTFVESIQTLFTFPKAPVIAFTPELYSPMPYEERG